MLDILLKSLGLNPSDPSVRNAIQQVFCEMPKMLEQLQHMGQDIARLRRAIESQTGRGSLDVLADQRMRPRRLEDPPFFFFQPATTNDVTIDLEAQLGRWPATGWIAVFSADCEVSLEYPHNQRTPFMPMFQGTTEAFEGYLVRVHFRPAPPNHWAYSFKLKAY